MTVMPTATDGEGVRTTMNARRVLFVLAIAAFAAAWTPPAGAQTIVPVATTAPFAPLTSSAVTLTLDRQNWLPTPGSSVQLTVRQNGTAVTPSAVRLVCPNGTTTVPCLPAAVDLTATPIVDQSNPVAAGTLTTSAYPGTCTNSGAPDNYAADFTLVNSVLTAQDCGGTAVVQVDLADGSQHTFVIPQDSDFDGIPDLYEAKFGTATGLQPTSDLDNDGLTSFDEYRGVMLSGTTLGQLTHVRLHPVEPDLFIAVVNPGCAGTVSLLGGGVTTYIPDASNALSLFDNLNRLLPATGLDPRGPRIHPIAYPSGAPVAHAASNVEWEDDYSDTNNRCSFNAATGDLVFNPPLSDLDRLVTRTAVYQTSESPNTTLTPSAASGTVTLSAGTQVFNRSHLGTTITVTGGPSTGVRAVVTAITSPTEVVANVVPGLSFSSPSVAIPALSWRLSGADQKGLRCIESSDTSSTSIFAISGWTTPNDTINCIIFSKRIEFRMLNTNTALGPQGLIPLGGSRKLRIQTYNGTGWITTFTEGDLGTTRAEAERLVVAEVVRFYVTMEYAHGGKLNPTIGTCGVHDCPAGTHGHINDRDFQQVIDRKTTGFNTFRIPTIPNAAHIQNFKLRNP